MSTYSTDAGFVHPESKRVLSTWECLVGVFYRPRAVVDSLALEPHWLTPWLLRALFYFLYLVAPIHLHQREIKYLRIDAFGIMQVITLFLTLLILAILLNLAGVLMGGSARYKAYLAVICYGSMPRVLEIIALAIMTASTGLYYDFSPLALMPAETDPLLKALLIDCSPVFIWQCGLIGLGTARINGLEKSKGILFGFLYWLLGFLFMYGIFLLAKVL